MKTTKILWRYSRSWQWDASNNRIVYQLDAWQKHVYVHLIGSERQDYDTLLKERILRF